MAKKKKSAAVKRKATSTIKVDYHLKGKSKKIVELYRIFSQMVRSCGPIKLKVSKSSIDFKRSRTFAVVWLNKNSLEGLLDMYKTIKDPRFKSATKTSRFIMTNKFKITNKRQLNSTFARFVDHAYRVGAIGNKTSLK